MQRFTTTTALVLLASASSIGAPPAPTTTTASTAATTTTTTTAATTAALQQQLEAVATSIEATRVAAQIPGLGVGVVVDGKVVWARGFGHRGDLKQPITAQTLFMIGSTTKAFTTAALGTLKDDGVIRFTDRVQQHLPAFDLADDRDTFLTLEDLASHGTGVDPSDAVWMVQPPRSRADILKVLPQLKLVGEPRAGFIYNNWMYATLGLVVEDKGGKRLGDVVKHRVLTPLGMTSTAMDYKTVPALKNRSLGHHRTDAGIVAVPWHDNPLMQAAGSAAVSTVDDMNRWLLFQLGDGSNGKGERVLSSATLQQLHTPVRVAQTDLADVDEPLNDYGWAWGSSVWRGHTRVAHSGGITGFSSLVTVLPNEKIGVVVLQNTTHAPIMGSVTDSIVEVLLGMPTRDRLAKRRVEIAAELAGPASTPSEPPMRLIAGTTPAHAVRDYAGRYASTLFDDVVVEEVSAGTLRLTIGGVQLGLKHGHYESFVVDTVSDPDHTSFWQAAAFTFTTALDGAVDGVTATIPDLGDVPLTKKKAAVSTEQAAKPPRAK